MMADLISWRMRLNFLGKEKGFYSLTSEGGKAMTDSTVYLTVALIIPALLVLGVALRDVIRKYYEQHHHHGHYHHT